MVSATTLGCQNPDRAPKFVHDSCTNLRLLALELCHIAIAPHSLQVEPVMVPPPIDQKLIAQLN
jgi:hypothetical protein